MNGVTQRYLEAFAAHWGLEARELERFVRPRLEQKFSSLDGPFEQVQAALEPLALEYRNRALAPVLGHLQRSLRSHLTSAFGFIPADVREDALSMTLEALVCHHWRAVWAKEAGRDYLWRYARKTAVRTAFKLLAGERPSRFLPLDGAEDAERDAVNSPELDLIREHEEQRRERIKEMLGIVLVLRYQFGLTPAEAAAIHRSLSPAPKAGLTDAEWHAHIKALQRAKKRLSEQRDALRSAERRMHLRRPESCTCTLEHSTWRGELRAIDYSEGGILLEAAGDLGGLKVGATVIVTLHRGPTPDVRGAHCVRITTFDVKVRVALAFHRTTPLSDLRPRT